MARPKKIVHFKLQEFRNISGTLSYRVTGTKPDGERVRKNFADKADALKEIADLEDIFLQLVEEENRGEE